VQVRIFLFLLMLMRAASGKSRMMRARFHIGTHRRFIMVEEGILFWGKENVLDERDKHFC
jgi:hypothetical protein